MIYCWVCIENQVKTVATRFCDICVEGYCDVHAKEHDAQNPVTKTREIKNARQNHSSYR